MDPRLKSSIKWTPFPVELVAQITEVMTESFDDFDLGGKFVVEGAIYPEEIGIRIGLAKPGQLRQDNFEATIPYSPEVDKATDKIHVLVDFLGQVWEAFLEDEPNRDELAVVYTEETFEKNKVFLKYSSVNSELEKQADALLAGLEKKLVFELDTELDKEPEDVLYQTDQNQNSDSQNDNHMH